MTAIPATAPRLLLTSQPETEVYPRCYVIVAKSQRCACCFTTHEWTEVYAETSYKGRWGQRLVTQLHAVAWPSRLYNLPIEHRVAKPQFIPMCHACNEPNLDHFDRPPVPQEATGKPLWAQTLEPAPLARPKHPTRPTRGASLDDLAKLVGG